MVLFIIFSRNYSICHSKAMQFKSNTEGNYCCCLAVLDNKYQTTYFSAVRRIQNKVDLVIISCHVVMPYAKLSLPILL